MKRFFFSILALAAVAAGCSKSNLIDDPSMTAGAIAFDTYLGRTPETRAVACEKAAVETNGITVYAWWNPDFDSSTSTGPDMSAFMPNYMNAVQLSKTTASWSYEYLMFWPNRGSVSFAAFANTANNSLTLTGGDPTAIPFAVADDVASQEDLLVAVPIYDASYEDQDGTGVSANTNNAVTSVPLNFKHLLSRIAFTVKAELLNLEGLSIRVNEVVLSGKFAQTATLNLIPDDIDPTNKYASAYLLEQSPKTTSYKLTNETHFDCPALNGASGQEPYELHKASENKDSYMMIIPCEGPVVENAQITSEGHEAKILIDYTICYDPDGDGEKVVQETDRSAEFVVTNDFEAGKAYKYNFTLSAHAISFSVDVENWGTEAGSDITDNNMEDTTGKESNQQ